MAYALLDWLIQSRCSSEGVQFHYKTIKANKWGTLLLVMILGVCICKTLWSEQKHDSTHEEEYFSHEQDHDLICVFNFCYLSPNNHSRIYI